MTRIRRSRKMDQWALKYSLSMHAVFENVTNALGHKASHESRTLRAVRPRESSSLFFVLFQCAFCGDLCGVRTD